MQTRRQIQRSARSWVILFVLLLLMGLRPLGRCWSAPVAEVNVSAGPRVDEELFLLYLLPVLYGSIGVANDSPDEAEQKRQLNEVRQQAVQLRQHAEEAKVDRRITRLYGDVSDVLDAVAMAKAETARSVGAVKRTNFGRNLPQSIGRGAVLGFAAFKVKELTGKNNVRPDNDALVGAGVAVATALFDAVYEGYKDVRASSEAEAAAREPKMAELQRFLAEIDARIQRTAQALVKERGWTDVEVANEATLQRVARCAAALQSKDYAEALQFIRQGLSFNPRSFFAHQAEETILASWTNRTTQQRLESAKHLVSTCRLVPDAAIYEKYRVSTLQDAAWQVIQALAEENRNAGRLWQPNETSRYAVAVLEETVRRVSPAQRPVMNLLLATTYGANQQFSAAEKVTADLRPFEATLVEQEPGTAGMLDYLQACIDSRQGETMSALQFLRKAVAGGCRVAKDWWEDADLESLRNAYPNEFAELLRVKAAWTIEYGILQDDVLVRNQSAFGMSNVRMKVAVVAQGKRHDANLVAEAIPAGQTFRWKNVLSIPRDPALSGALEIECDQSPGVVTADFQSPPP